MIIYGGTATVGKGRKRTSVSKFPRLLINLPKLAHNYQTLQRRCREAGIELTVVVKGLAGDRPTVECLMAAGLRALGDSRLENLTNYQSYPGLQKMQLRLPTPETAAQTVQLTEISLNTEPVTLEALNYYAGLQERKHRVILMVDLGDLREGVSVADLPGLAEYCRQLRHLEVIGIGADFACFAGVLPTPAALTQLTTLAGQLRSEYHLPIQYVSGGNSSSLPLLYERRLPPGVNHLRIGEGILLGRETFHGTILPDLWPDVFCVEASVLQAQWKSGKATGLLGCDALGRKMVLPKMADGWRLLLGIGEQETPLAGLTPLDPGITILGGSSDYMVAAGQRRYSVGQILRFKPNYWSLLALMSSGYVTKEYREF
jgi:predicted amino acid racemase